ncbi:dihydrolipoamide acetyltransferase family protein [Novosphingobium sp. PASSN1]|uniref:dihydrolipoamide acetyltransferase family protein n=1 Tax=Novosphingobium sp. PASSN1 TaxID=2015561 RepID=UPI000BC7A1F9|nr:dihydrolipoamide acetyltransferase family protein [Novosphingobium sp. PASSN1]OYU34514.1 MAG: pyruvate dehydrogenase complex dihydrolipoamide acetyltransferase [Novosphingobium sp. PASSN1]
MALELKMPALSPTMESGSLAKWLVSVGDLVKPGDILAEIETDKATMEFEAADEGHVTEIRVPEGSENVAVGAVIAVLGEAADVAAPTPQPKRETVEATPAMAVRAVPDVAVPAEPATATPATAAPSAADATPLARRIADATTLDLSGIKGTGPRGKIVKADLGLKPISGAPAATPADQSSLERPAPVMPPPADVPVETMKLPGMRKTIARRLTQSKQTIPHFYLTVRCNIDALLKLRQDINASLSDHGVKLSVNDLLIKAMARAMELVPDTNVQFGGEHLHRFSRVDIAMAVAIEGGLVTPVIRDAGALSLSAIARQSKDLAAKARAGKLMPADYQGGTASISNLGMFGIDEMIPVINPPQALILGVGAGIEQPWKVGSEIALATIMAATASFDHRVIDGAIAAQFMAALRNLIETPMQLVS